MKKLQEFLKKLKTDIYQGEKLEENFKIISFTAWLICLVTFAFLAINYGLGRWDMVGATLTICLVSAVSIISVKRYRNRYIPMTLFWVVTAVLFSLYAIRGSSEGFAILWILIAPIFYMYILDVRFGILLGFYFQILVIILFWTPIKSCYAGIYTETFIERFPILYFLTFILSSCQMIQYHLGELEKLHNLDNLTRAVEEERERVTKFEREQHYSEVENASRMEFLSNISHEIKTPINTIIGMNELIRKECKDQNILNYADNANKASNDLMAYIDDLLKLSKTEGQIHKGAFEKVDLAGLTVLVVDDYKTNLMIIENYLKDANCKVTLCGGGAEAVKLSLTNKYDVILLDHMMPDIDGVQVAKAIRDNYDNPNNDSWIIAVTANPDRQLFIENGFDEYIGKPIRYNELICVLAEHCANRIKYKDAAASLRYDLFEGETAPHANDLYEESGAGFMSTAKEEIVAGNMAGADKYDFNDESSSDYIDIDVAMEYCLDDKEFYKELIESFAEDYDSNVDGLKKAYDEKRYEAYKVIVHGLKNSARTLGAIAFSELSKKHEFAVTDGEYHIIEEGFEEYLKEYDSIVAKLKEVAESI